ncbi:uncharacterized protein LOC127931811 isoform X1 [Oncorhynchus keta]|uniref:uncharacterized protein LOC127931811 isoform X1 n=1 Tax=Oncorhynchus keta TaxID=8018 RepID=UPI00227AF16F|nr:uncharacterized protein LOC127931811 isoform X1 [Oncorhynchus keta]
MRLHGPVYPVPPSGCLSVSFLQVLPPVQCCQTSVLSCRNLPPILSCRSLPPVLSCRSLPPVLSCRSLPPVLSCRSLPPVLSCRSLPPVLSCRSLPPVLSCQSLPPVLSCRSPPHAPHSLGQFVIRSVLFSCGCVSPSSLSLPSSCKVPQPASPGTPTPVKSSYGGTVPTWASGCPNRHRLSVCRADSSFSRPVCGIEVWSCGPLCHRGAAPASPR